MRLACVCTVPAVEASVFAVLDITPEDATSLLRHRDAFDAAFAIDRSVYVVTLWPQVFPKYWWGQPPASFADSFLDRLDEASHQPAWVPVSFSISDDEPDSGFDTDRLDARADAVSWRAYSAGDAEVETMPLLWSQLEAIAAGKPASDLLRLP